VRRVVLDGGGEGVENGPFLRRPQYADRNRRDGGGQRRATRGGICRGR
jgi:hypothetical protein